MELAVILVIILLIFGPKSLPSLGRAIGDGLREFKSASRKMSEALHEAEEEDKRKEADKKRDTPKLTGDNEKQGYRAPEAPRETVGSTTSDEERR